ncbi:MAG: ATP-binding cassette domain-containing protein, partial [Lactobacillaceae bacterium]|nr:ATP-binding cassette domain-containing protein [Lactobacillaceae bacterium]
MPYLELRNIEKSYTINKKEKFKVLKGISASFDKGELVSLLGESGGGKSTLLNIIGGLDHDYSGEVLLDNKPTSLFNEKQMDEYRRKTIGFVFQSFNLISHLNILENVMMSLDMTTLDHSQKVKRATELLKQVGLEDHIKKYPNQISGGQKQRVAIARALSSNPDIIIADEPTGALDGVNTQEILKMLQDIAQQGKLVLIVTHSSEVANFGTRIVHISEGKIDSDKKIKKAFSPDQKQQDFESKTMPASTSYLNAFKHLTYHFWRNFLIMLGTAIGLFAVMLFLGLGNGINAFIQDQINSMVNPLSVNVMRNPEGKKISKDEFAQATQKLVNDPTSALMSQNSIDQIKKLKGQNAVEPGYQFNNISGSSNEKNVQFQQLQTWTKAFSPSLVKFGTKTPNDNEAFIGLSQAKTLFGSGKKALNQKITIAFTYLNEKKMPVQINKEYTIGGVIDGSQVGDVVSLNYKTARDLLKQYDAITDPMFVSVNAKSTDDVKKVANKIDDIKIDGKNYFYAITVGNILDTVNKYTSVAAIALASIAAISLIVSALMIIVTMYMS